MAGTAKPSSLPLLGVVALSPVAEGQEVMEKQDQDCRSGFYFVKDHLSCQGREWSKNKRSWKDGGDGDNRTIYS